MYNKEEMATSSDKGFIAWLSAYARTTRLEYIPGEVPALLVMLFLATDNFASMLTPVVMGAALVFLLLFTAGFAINAVTDYEIDRNYGTFKSKLPDAVERVGKKGMWAMIILETLTAIALSVYISAVMRSTIPIFLVVLGVFMGLGYSVWPLRFKERGLLHAISLGSSAFYLPCLFLFYVISGGMSLYIVVFFLGFTFIHYGMEFGNQAIDYFEDRDSMVMTPPVRWGLRRSLWFGLYLMVIGFGIEVAMLPVMVSEKMAGSAALQAIPMNIWLAGFSALLLGGYLLPFLRTAQMIKASGETVAEAEVSRKLRKLCKYSRWQFSGIMGLTVVSALLFLSPMLFPLIQTPSQEIEMGELSANIYVDFPENSSSRVLMTVEVVSQESHSPGDLSVVARSWFAGYMVSERTIDLNRSLDAGELWIVDIVLFTGRTNATRFEAEILRNQGERTEVIWHEKIPCSDSIYISSARYEILQGYIVGRKADVSAKIYSDRETMQANTMELVITAYSSFGVFLDRERVTIGEKMEPGNTYDFCVTLDILDSGSAYFTLELISVQGQTYDMLTIK